MGFSIFSHLDRDLLFIYLSLSTRFYNFLQSPFFHHFPAIFKTLVGPRFLRAHQTACLNVHNRNGSSRHLFQHSYLFWIPWQWLCIDFIAKVFIVQGMVLVVVDKVKQSHRVPDILKNLAVVYWFFSLKKTWWKQWEVRLRR